MAVVVSPVCTAVTWQGVYMLQYFYKSILARWELFWLAVPFCKLGTLLVSHLTRIVQKSSAFPAELECNAVRAGSVLWNVTPYSLANVASIFRVPALLRFDVVPYYRLQRFGGMYSLHLQGCCLL
jgi:hypothetical protein